MRLVPGIIVLSLFLLGLSLFGGADGGASGREPGDVKITWGVKVPLRDGVKLNATVYQPAGNEGNVPIVFTLTPYIADNYHDRAMFFARNGYVFVLVDARGRGNSEGKFEPSINEGRDGHDVVEFLAKQTYGNGKIAMWGGSYAGFDQWVTLKEAPPHLQTIVPAASAHPCVDFPSQNGIIASYWIRWLTLTSGVTPNQKLFGEAGYWRQVFRKRFVEHRPFRELDQLAGNPSPHFQRWLDHSTPDDYWAPIIPTADDYRRMRAPILTITGHYDDDQLGAMAFYHGHFKHGSPEGKVRHFLVMGPWDHAGTRTPTEEVGGVKFGKASMVDMNALHKEWYDWTLKGGPRPDFLKKQVCYYVAGAEEWRYADTLEGIPTKPLTLYLTAGEGQGGEVFRAGTLQEKKSAQGKPMEYTYDPLDISAVERENEEVKAYLLDQRQALAIKGTGLVFHSQPFEEEVEIIGYPRLTAWMALDVPDTDFEATLSEVRPDGTSIGLSDSRLRARYRESLTEPKLVKPGEINRYELQSFTWFARRLAKGSRLRLVLTCPNSIYWQKNYNSGGDVTRETRQDARIAHVRVYQDGEHASRLQVAISSVKDKR
jgi:putative CocE/NonD family hydrolase